MTNQPTTGNIPVVHGNKPIICEAGVRYEKCVNLKLVKGEKRIWRCASCGRYRF